MVGTIHLDCRGLVHRYENGAWYQCEVLKTIKSDFEPAFRQSGQIQKENLKMLLFHRCIRAVVKVLAPMI